MLINIMPVVSEVWSFVRYTWDFCDSIILLGGVSLLDVIVGFIVLSTICSLLFSINKGGDNDD